MKEERLRKILINLKHSYYLNEIEKGEKLYVPKDPIAFSLIYDKIFKKGGANEKH